MVRLYKQLQSDPEIQNEQLVKDGGFGSWDSPADFQGEKTIFNGNE